MSKLDRSTHVDTLELTEFSAAPFTPDSTERFLAAYSNALYFYNGSSWVEVGVSSSGSTPTWETLFAADATFTITPDTTFTIAGNRSTATDVLTVTNSAGGSGDCIQITNAGSGYDIEGTSGTWFVTKAGAATFVGITPGGDITSSSTAIDWDLVDNNASALSIDGPDTAGMLNFVTTDGSEAVTTSVDFTVSDGVFTSGSTSNTAITAHFYNDTVTTFGNGATEDQGVVVMSSDTLTTGDLLRLQLDESALNGGAFLKMVQTDAAAAVFTVGENGATTIAGAGGSNMLTVTAGDVVVSDGSITLTDADNAATLAVVNNTVTTANQIVSVASTSLTTGAVMTLNANNTGHDAEILELISAGDATSTPTGLSVTIASPTTGAATGIAVTMAAATTGPKGIAVTMDALTEGHMLYLDNGGGTLTSGTYINCNDDGAVDFSVGANGATVITGSAAGTDALTLTAGDITVTSGYVNISAGGIQTAAVARTTTADGTGTGLIADGTTYVTVTSAGANNILTLPTPTPGNIVYAYVGANGYELRSDTPASVAINGGTGANAESAIAANTLIRCVCTSSTTWVCSQFAADGTESKVEAAA